MLNFVRVAAEKEPTYFLSKYNNNHYSKKSLPLSRVCKERGNKLAKISRAYANIYTYTWCSPLFLMING